jgi:outer membrane protein assembly factor BamB
MFRRSLIGLALATLLPVSTSHARAEDTWPQWRGPTRDGSFHGAAWPASLDTNSLHQTWSIPLGPGYSGPVVTPSLVYVTETVSKKTERVTALDRKTGKVRWTREWEGAMSVPFFAKSNGDWIRSTPAWDGTRLYVAGMRDVLVCLDGEDGTERWRIDFVQALKSELPAFGFVSSPLVDGDSVYVQAGNGVARIEAATGKILWHACKEGGGMSGGSFGSPAIFTLAGIRQLVVPTRSRLVGLSLKDGAELWSQPIESFRGMNILTPVLAGKDRLFSSAYGGKTLGIDIRSNGDRLTSSVAWEYKAQGYMTTPVVIDGHAYFHLRSQRAMCIDLTAGTEKWTSGESFGKYWSLVSNQDRVLALDEKGELILFRATPDKLDILSRRKISNSDTWAHLAVAGQSVFIRSLDGLTAWNWSASVSPDAR